MKKWLGLTMVAWFSVSCGGDTGRRFGDGGNPQGDGGSGDGGIVGEPVTCDQAASSKSYIGCDYWPTPVTNFVWSIFDFTVVVANVGFEPADIQVTGPNGVNQNTSVAPNQLVKIFLPWVSGLKGSDFDNCGNSTVSLTSLSVASGAYHLVSSRPVVVYQFNALEYQGQGGAAGKSWTSCPGSQICPSLGVALGCFSFSNDASLLLPSTAMTGNYRITSVAGIAAGPVQRPSYFAITATRDGTDVNVKVSSTGQILAGGGIPATAAGGTTQFKMNAGQVIELVGSAVGLNDLSGSLVQASQPVQVIVGNPCMTNPVDKAACDHVEESVPPAETFGQRYIVTVPTAPNGNVVGHVVRIYGNVDGTQLTYDPAIPGAPATIAAGEVVDLGQIKTDFMITGDAAFAVGSFMLGASLLDPSTPPPMQKGDPSFSMTTAIEQYRVKYVFLAPNDYDVSYVDVVAPTSAQIEIDGAPVSQSPKAIGGSGFGILRLKLGTGASGAHTLTASEPVGIQVIGYGSYTSYQFPGGLDLRAIAPPPIF